MNSYHVPKGGLPPQSKRTVDRAVFTEAYAFIPAGVFSDIVTSNLPNWNATRAWIIARPMTGFAETFAQYVMEVGAGGGSEHPEPDANAQGVLFVTHGHGVLEMEGAQYALEQGSYAYIPAGIKWRFHNPSNASVHFHWIRKAYEAAFNVEKPAGFVTNERDITPAPMPDTNGAWATTRFVDPDDIRHDMHVNIVTFQPGGVIPFDETHVMEHGLYVLEGKALYHLNRDWIEVEAGDFMWLRAFCPQSCYAAGDRPFRYLLYKDVNRHPKLTL